ncbi:transmembrane amino acid transporter protein-domain-containing protein [Phakopsora pachyrhizi]|nr:transmembrane amino acid transporter protein-domain-containing protein [Phakopsora pachyrhizi]KAI8456473.1 transmembrane amino acid transporter protein-domain-containing protein [Phakopsora pachyrhizi]
MSSSEPGDRRGDDGQQSSESADQLANPHSRHQQQQQRSSNLTGQLAERRVTHRPNGSSPVVPPNHLPPPRSSTGCNITNLSIVQTPSNRFLSAEVNNPRSSPSMPITDRSDSPGKTNNNSSSSTPRLSALSGLADELTEGQKVRIVRRHLMSKGEQRAARRKRKASAAEFALSNDSRRFDLSGEDDFEDGTETGNEDADEWENPGSSDNPTHYEDSGPQEEYPTPFHLPGGDINHALYKWASKRPTSNLANVDQSRGDSMAEITNDLGTGLTHRDIMEPGGFRRAFLYQKRAAIGKPYDPEAGKNLTRSFVDFLSLYGHFGGEDLEEIDEREEEAYKALRSKRALENGQSYSDDGNESDDERVRTGVNERSSLLNKSTNLRSINWNRRTTSAKVKSLRSKYPGFRDGNNGNASVSQAVFMTLKSLVGTGILLLAKAFANGGILFSILMLIIVSIMSLYSYVLLVQTRLHIAGGFGEMGGILYGPWFRNTILFSLVISQLGFVAAYTIFIAQSLQAFILAVSQCKHLVPIFVLIFAQVLVYLPLAMIRNIQKLSWTALVADAFILIGLLYVFGYEFSSIATKGAAQIKLFNPESFPLMIGTAVFTFEGIGLVIPITESMKEPQKFPRVLVGVMVGLTFLFAGAGAAGYVAYGANAQPVVLLNLPQSDKSVNAVQFLYSMAIMLSTPLQLFPAVRIMENGLFSESGKYSDRVKWKKNFFRIGTVLFCALTAWAGANDFDKFVSLIGSVACVPLCFCYPAMLHYKAIAKTFRQKAIDLGLAAFGAVAAVYTTYQTVSLILKGNEANESPLLGNC